MLSSKDTSGFAADAARYGTSPIAAYYQLQGGGGSTSGTLLTFIAPTATLPDTGGGGGGTSATLVSCTGLTVGQRYLMNVRLSLGIAAGTTTGWTPGGCYLFGFQSDPVKPTVAGVDTSGQLLYTNQILGSTLVSAQSPSGGNILSVSFTSYIVAQATTHNFSVNFVNGGAISPSNQYGIVPPGQNFSYIQMLPV